MSEENRLLSASEQLALEGIAGADTIEEQRATALLAVNDGSTQAEAAAIANLTRGQVAYILRKFRQQRLNAFSIATTTTEEPEAATPDVISVEEEEDEAEALDEAAESLEREKKGLLADLDKLVTDLSSMIGTTGAGSSDSPYSPLNMLTLVRDNIERLAPDAQLNILQSLQGMEAKDLLDLETWKGIAYTITYAAQFQADQTREKLNEQLPDPLKPDTVIQFMQKNAEKFTPEIVQNILGTFGQMDREAMRDPNTWKAMAFMMRYAAEQKAEETRTKLNEQLPHPLKPDTILGLMKSTYEAVTPDMAKAVIQGFAGMSREDLVNPETWKAMWQMLNYSLQFQMDQLKERITNSQSS
ncbi:MAG: helix-turn-helix domain-containing protein [Chloroflexota bacterium]